ncbi:hypothetical protein AC579_4041 [Pseudocercospora musae]|uniref:Uncharacterized protein n=1 Tax=Pseudocercospora musae TaxID=113226 RepID=A0A139IEB7_9PEZI|nr:hypothetical protein AC579_4041 [Pseudocercospora musae]
MLGRCFDKLMGRWQVVPESLSSSFADVGKARMQCRPIFPGQRGASSTMHALLCTHLLHILARLFGVRFNLGWTPGLWIDHEHPSPPLWHVRSVKNDAVLVQLVCTKNTNVHFVLGMLDLLKLTTT